jgi:hypothetical protein
VLIAVLMSGIARLKAGRCGGGGGLVLRVLVLDMRWMQSGRLVPRVTWVVLDGSRGNWILVIYYRCLMMVMTVEVVLALVLVLVRSLKVSGMACARGH